MLCLCSYIRGMLTSQALLVGVGLGQEAATPTAAVFQFLMRYAAALPATCTSTLSDIAGGNSNTVSLTLGRSLLVMHLQQFDEKPCSANLILILHPAYALRGCIACLAAAGTYRECWGEPLSPSCR